MKRRLRKQARKLLWLVNGDYALLRDGWPGLWQRLLLASHVPPERS